jgi:AcrR family transcriptional regulator
VKKMDKSDSSSAGTLLSEGSGGVGAEPVSRPRRGARESLLDAAQACLLTDGFAQFSTRRVAELAGIPLSQIHYHFGSRQGLVLALLDSWNARLLHRQEETFTASASLAERWDRACDHLDEDLASGYVRVLQEMIAAGWADPTVAEKVRSNLEGWYELLTELAEEAGRRFGGLGPFSAADVACLVGHAFIGSEALILLGLENDRIPARGALRRFGDLLRQLETAREA